MRAILHILQKVFISHFYAANAGFFLFIFFIFFGLPYHPLSFHRTMILGIIQSQVFLGFVFIAWLLYNVKCLDYTLKQLVHPQQLFLFTLNNLSSVSRFGFMAFVQVALYMPVLLYSVAMIVIAAHNNQIWAIIEIVLFHLAALYFTTRLYVNWLSRTNQSALATRPATRLHPGVEKRLWLWPFLYLWSTKKQMIFVAKIFTLFFLYLFLALYEPEKYDLRPALLCLMVVAAANSAIVYQVRNFEDTYLIFTKNLPISILKRFGSCLFLYCFLSLPEILLLCKGFGVHFGAFGYAQLVVFVIALQMLFHSTLLMANTTMDQFIRIVFGLMATLFFIIMYNPGVLLPIILLGFSFLFFSAYFYVFEKQEKAT